jgi:hypothetical protein
MGRRVLTVVMFHPTGDFIHRLAPAVALAGEPFEHVGLAGLLAGVNAVARKSLTATGWLLTSFENAQDMENLIMQCDA